MKILAPMKRKSPQRANQMLMCLRVMVPEEEQNVLKKRKKKGPCWEGTWRIQGVGPPQRGSWGVRNWAKRLEE